MKSFYQFILEDMSNPRDVARQTTKDLEPMFVWLNTQQSGQKLVKTDKKWAKTRDLVSREIAKRAKKGDREAKAAFKHMEVNKLHHKGQTQRDFQLEGWSGTKYIVEKNPHDKKWYAMGHVGKNKWMPVSNGFKSKAEAQKWAKIQAKVVNPAAEKELGGI